MIVTVPQISDHIHQIIQLPLPPRPKSRGTTERRPWTRCRRRRTRLWRTRRTDQLLLIHHCSSDVLRSRRSRPFRYVRQVSSVSRLVFCIRTDGLYSAEADGLAETTSTHEGMGSKGEAMS